jgi:hypothetical protein
MGSNLRAIMRLAGQPEIYDALAQHFISDDVPPQAAQHLAAEVVTHGSDAETSIDRFFHFYELLKSKGYSEQAAQHLAVEMMEGREPESRTGMRFARVYGDEPCGCT